MFKKPSSCESCLGFKWDSKGFMPTAIGEGNNGVLLVGEALGEDEARVGKPFQGRAGQALNQMLQRRGLDRKDFWIDNVLRCRPNNNKLSGESYEAEVIENCSIHLANTISTLKPRCIVAMGDIPLKALVCPSSDGAGITKRRGYVEWSEKFNCWVVPTFHPSYIMRGNQHLSGVWLRDIEHAVEIAKNGFQYHQATLIEDPTPYEFKLWVEKFELEFAANPNLWLAYDIETPMKGDVDEDDLEFDDRSYEIQRISFAYRVGEAVSVPWCEEYKSLFIRLLGSGCVKITWNGAYDKPRVIANGVPVNGIEYDIMWAWHKLQSDLPKGLGFVTTIFAQDQKRWKFLSHINPAYYNAIDSEVTLRLGEVVIKELKTLGMWELYFNHVVRLNEVLTNMSNTGMLVDIDKLKEVSTSFNSKLSEIHSDMESTIPIEARRLKVYKSGRIPEGVQTVDIIEDGKVKVCNRCGAEGVLKPHVAKVNLPQIAQDGVKTLRVPNPCHGATIEEIIKPRAFKAVLLPFVPSNAQMLAYQEAMNHQPPPKKSAGGAAVSFDEGGLDWLIKKYKSDPLYPKVLEYRKLEKLLTTYVDGLPVGSDNRVHPTYTHTPSTGRLACVAPNMQNIPRGGNEYTDLIKLLYVADPDYLLWEIDYSAIEAVLVGYFAGDKDYIRLSKLGVHDYLNSFILAKAGKISKPADASWPDADLKAFFKDIKKRFPLERYTAKRIIHGGNYGMTPRRMSDLYPEEFPTTKLAKDLQDLYFDVCPKIKTWQNHTVNIASKQGYLKNPFGEMHRFWNVLSWTKERDGEWHSSWGEDAKRSIAFMPQSTAAGIIKDAILLIHENNLSNQLRLQVHDSLVGATHKDRLEEVLKAIVYYMTLPNKHLVLDPSWGLGEYLKIDVETKVGLNWSNMEVY